MTFPSKLLLAGMCLSALLLGCKEDSSLPTHDCVCTREIRLNICVTLNGSATLPDSLTFVRARTGALDTLDKSTVGNHCFGEHAGSQRILMFRNGIKLDSSASFVTKTVDCCHGEAYSVNFTR